MDANEATHYADMNLHSILDIFQLKGGKKKVRPNSRFTFHSGYIPIASALKVMNAGIMIYIPFWIYSNSKHLLPLFFTCRLIYIPFWIYSNLKDKVPYDAWERYLHSILDIFQLTSRMRYLGLCGNLHSILDIFQFRLLSYHLFTPFKTLFFVYLDFFYRQSMVFL